MIIKNFLFNVFKVLVYFLFGISITINIWIILIQSMNDFLYLGNILFELIVFSIFYSFIKKCIVQKNKLSKYKFNHYFTITFLEYIMILGYLNLCYFDIKIEIFDLTIPFGKMLLLSFILPLNFLIVKRIDELVFDGILKKEEQAKKGEIRNFHIYHEIDFKKVFKMYLFSGAFLFIPVYVLVNIWLPLILNFNGEILIFDNQNQIFFIVFVILSIFVSYKFFKYKSTFWVEILYTHSILSMYVNNDKNYIINPEIILKMFILLLGILLLPTTVTFLQVSIFKMKKFLIDREREWRETFTNMNRELYTFTNLNSFHYEKDCFEMYQDMLLEKLHQTTNLNLQYGENRELEKKIKKMKNQLNSIDSIEIESKILYKILVGVILSIFSLTGILNLIKDIKLFGSISENIIFHSTAFIICLCILYGYFAALSFQIYLQVTNLNTLKKIIISIIDNILVEISDD